MYTYIISLTGSHLQIKTIMNIILTFSVSLKIFHFIIFLGTSPLLYNYAMDQLLHSINKTITYACTSTYSSALQYTKTAIILVLWYHYFYNVIINFPVSWYHIVIMLTTHLWIFSIKVAEFNG